MSSPKVLLTGITGFLGSHTAIQLLNKGYEVVGTLRDMGRADSIRAVLGKHTPHLDRLHLAQAELTDAQVWPRLMQGVQYVQHIASPFPRVLPKNDDELVVPAREGVLGILRAASASGVKRVVLTSSSGAVLYGKPSAQRSGVFDETTWTDVTDMQDTTPYFRSKTIAERAAWDFMASDRSGMELSTVLPGAILGPLLEEDFSGSANIVIKSLDGSVPAVPNIGFDMVDVRSVAELLVLAMEKPQAANQRYIGSEGYLSFKDVADILRAAYPKRRIPSRVLPNFAVRLFSYVDPTLKPILLDLGARRELNNNKAIQQLGWRPRTPKEGVLACAASAIALGVVK
jgi:nucleoside-diphosphate-sugar epimerase